MKNISKKSYFYEEKALEEFKAILRLPQDQLLLTLKKNFDRVYKNYFKMSTDKFLYYEGREPVLVVAHLDTVYERGMVNSGLNHYNHMHIYFSQQDKVLWSPEGLGADDRLGVWMIVNLIRAGVRPYILFTTDEEIGCAGADSFVETFYEVELLSDSVNKVKYLLELDRRGSNDCVFYDCDNTEFHKYIESFGWEYQVGSFSDISVLMEFLDIAGVNLSVGYYNEHNLNEMCNLLETEKNFFIIKTMIEKSIEIKEKFPALIQKQQPFFANINNCDYNSYDYAYGYDFDEKANTDSNLVCECCRNKDKKVFFSGKYNMVLCEDCYDLFEQ